MSIFLQGGEDASDALSCRSLSAKEPLNTGLFRGSWPLKIRHAMHLRHPVHMFPTYIFEYLSACVRERASERRMIHSSLSACVRVSLHVYESLCMCTRASDVWSTSLDVYCSTAQGLLDWFEVDLGFTELLFIQIDLCVMCTRASDVWSNIKFLSAEVHLSTYVPYI